MKKFLLLLALISSVINAEELVRVQVPHDQISVTPIFIPTASTIDKIVAAPKPDCESCKENKVSPSLWRHPNVPANIINLVEIFKHKSQCRDNRKRLTSDVSFYVNGEASKLTVSGNWQPGFLSNGTVSDLYVRKYF
jgi:hypothetical protein